MGDTTISKLVPDDQQLLPKLPVQPDDMMIFSDPNIVLQPPLSSVFNTKPNKSNKGAPKSIEKIYVNQTILKDKMNNIRNIFIYNIPAG
ncbi:hypothetical protein RCL_jg5891.t1 [Rhizophagus clarus]|uniref:Uncharacterized protein n=1 Tax=Rhizophagus clarus TaxID=94130 RepID=A0A8H3QW90_9GLOM|nr:hypothetical protein RCL_jg5891.t1 [Rhizophagus clarus]